MIDRKVAKELLHVRDWLDRAQEIVDRGKDAIANRNWLIHQYDEIDREITWTTLARDLPSWRQALARAFDSAEDVLAGDAGRQSSGVSGHSTAKWRPRMNTRR